MRSCVSFCAPTGVCVCVEGGGLGLFQLVLAVSGLLFGPFLPNRSRVGLNQGQIDPFANFSARGDRPRDRFPVPLAHLQHESSQFGPSTGSLHSIMANFVVLATYQWGPFLLVCSTRSWTSLALPK